MDLCYIGNVNHFFFRFHFSQISVIAHYHPKWLPVHRSVHMILTVRKWVEFVVQINAIQNHVLALRLVHKVPAVDHTKDQQVRDFIHIIFDFCSNSFIILDPISFQLQPPLGFIAAM